MKLSFPLSSKPSTPNNLPFNDDDEQPETQQTPQTEFITEFTTSTPPTQKPTFTIPPLQNTWKPIQETPPIQETTTTTNTTMSYGLNLRTKKVTSDKNVGPSLIELKMLRKYREDMMNLPEDKGPEEFVDVPVEEYGKAVLAGYGWYEGRGIGKNAKEDVKVVEYEGGVGRHGLGFVPKTEQQQIDG